MRLDYVTSKLLVPLVCLLFLLGGPIPSIPAEDSLDGFPLLRDKDPWLRKPQTPADPGARDRVALRELSKLVEQKQSREFRKYFQVLLPKRSSGLPEKYELLVYGKYTSSIHSALRLSIQVDGTNATGELVDSQGISQGVLPWSDVDLLARQLAYAFQAHVKQKDPDVWPGVGRSFATHYPDFTVELIGREGIGVHLRTEPMQLLGDTIDLRTGFLQGFIHTRVCNQLQQMAKERLQLSSLDEQRLRIIRGLKDISTERIANRLGSELLEVTHYLRDDLPAVDAVIFPHLAVKFAIPEAKAELKRLNSVKAISELEIATSEDPLPALTAAILGDDYDLRKWALEFADRTDPRYVQMLVDLLPRLRETREGGVGEVLGRLRNRKLSPQQRAAVQEQFTEAPKGLAKVELCSFLLDQTGEEPYFDFLLELARQNVDQADKRTDVVTFAFNGLLDYSGRTKKRRDEAYTLLKRRLNALADKSKPDSFEYFELIRYLGNLGTRDDLPVLEGIADEESGYAASFAIDAITKIDPAIAVKKARQRLQRFVSSGSHGVNVYSWNVSRYFDLFLWQQDRSTISLLKQARSLLSEEDLLRHGGQADPQLLIGYLEAETPQARVDALLKFTKHHHLEDEWLNDVIAELRKAGADANRLAELEKAADE